MVKENIKAVHDDDLVQLLKNLNIFDKINNGEIVCKFCGCVIDLNNLETLFPESGMVKICCSKSECIKELYELMAAKEKTNK